MADQPPSVDLNAQAEGQSAAAPATVDRANPPAPVEKPRYEPRDPAAFGGPTYQEIRKGVGPSTPVGIDGHMFDDRYTSQYMLVNLPGERWKPVKPLFIPE